MTPPDGPLLTLPTGWYVIHGPLALSEGTVRPCRTEYIDVVIQEDLPVRDTRVALLDQAERIGGRRFPAAVGLVEHDVAGCWIAGAADPERVVPGSQRGQHAEAGLHGGTARDPAHRGVLRLDMGIDLIRLHTPQPGQREGRLKPPASCLTGTVRILGEDFHGPGRSRWGTHPAIWADPQGVLSVL